MERAERADAIAHGATDDGRADGESVLRADAAAVLRANAAALPVYACTNGARADDSAHPVAHDSACAVTHGASADDSACPVAHVTTRSVAHGALADAAANPGDDDA